MACRKVNTVAPICKEKIIVKHAFVFNVDSELHKLANTSREKLREKLKDEEYMKAHIKDITLIYEKESNGKDQSE